MKNSSILVKLIKKMNFIKKKKSIIADENSKNSFKKA